MTAILTRVDIPHEVAQQDRIWERHDQEAAKETWGWEEPGDDELNEISLERAYRAWGDAVSFVSIHELRYIADEHVRIEAELTNDPTILNWPGVVFGVEAGGIADWLAEYRADPRYDPGSGRLVYGDEHEHYWAHALAGVALDGHGTNEQEAPSMAAGQGPDEDTGGQTSANLPSSTEDAVRGFWRERPELRDMWWRSQVGRVSPWAVLGYVLAMVSVRVGPHVRLPEDGSLNLLVALEGESGEGKQRAKGPAGRFVGGPMVPPRKPGTGQGIASMFSEHSKEGVVQVNDTAWLNETEISSLGAHSDMKGSNLVSTLLAAFMGEQLGEHYADKTKRREVHEGAYRLALTVGVQPTNAGMLLDHQASGLSQRFLWVPALWPDAVLPLGTLVPPAPGPELPPWEPWPAILPGSLDPEVEDWTPSAALQRPKQTDGPIPVPVKDPIEVSFAPSVWREIQQEDARRQNRLKERRLTGQFGGDPDSHGVLLRLTVAALLAIWLDRRAYVSEEMWSFSAAVSLVSAHSRTRAEVGSRHQSRQRTAARHRDALDLDQKRREAADEVEESKLAKVRGSMRGSILRRLEKPTDPDGWMSTSELARACDSTHKKLVGGVPGVRALLVTMKDLGEVQTSEAANNAGGERWRLPRR